MGGRLEVTICDIYGDYGKAGLFLEGKPFRRFVLGGFTADNYILQEYHIVGNKGTLTGEWKISLDGMAKQEAEKLALEKMENSLKQRSYIELLNKL